MIGFKDDIKYPWNYGNTKYSTFAILGKNPIYILVAYHSTIINQTVFRNQYYFTLWKHFDTKYFSSLFSWKISACQTIYKIMWWTLNFGCHLENLIFFKLFYLLAFCFLSQRKEWICQRYFIIKIQGEVKSCTRTVAG